MLYSNIVAVALVFPTLQLAQAAPSASFQAHYIKIGQQDRQVAIAVAAQGGVFVVSTITDEASGFPAIRITRTDSQGNITSAYDFGENSMPTASVLDLKGIW